MTDYRPRRAKELFDRLLLQVPEFSDLYRTHLEDNDELLPYPLMDEFTRFILQSVAASPKGGLSAEAERGLRFLNESYDDGDEEVRLLINSTFSESVETMYDDLDGQALILSRLSSGLRATVAE